MKVIMATLLGNKIRKLRKAKGLTLDELAEATGSSKSYIWELENKDGVNPSGEKLFLLAKELNTNVEFLIDDNKREQSNEDIRTTFFRRYESLSPDKKQALDAFLKHLDNEPKS